MKRQVRIERIKAVEREYFAAKASIKLLEERLLSDSTFGLNRRWQNKDVRNLRDIRCVRLVLGCMLSLRRDCEMLGCSHLAVLLNHE